MATDVDLAYIAGLMDGEAYIGIKKAKAYRCQDRVTPSYHARIGIRMVDEAAIRFIAETLGGWYYREKRAIPNRQALWTYQVTDRKAETILRALLPYLRVKRASADAVLALRDLQSRSKEHRTKVVGSRNFPNKYGTPRTVLTRAFSDEYVARCDALWARCKELNAVGDAAISRIVA